MSQMPVEAEVVLTTDNSQYDQAMVSSAGVTDTLGQSVDTLTRKLDNLSKSAGKKMLGIAAADVAAITGATAAWAAYENQMSRLHAQSAITTRGMEQQNKVFNQYASAVNDLRKSYGDSTGAASDLVSSVAKLTSPTQQRDLKGLTETFSLMSKATGENPTGLATSLLGLQKVMGTEITDKTTRKYADQMTYLSQQTSLSAQGLTEFTAQLAPAATLLDMTQTQVAGVATAFAKAGQDGYAAANVFTQMSSDIAYAAQTGSPKLATYANLVGMTAENFKALTGSEQIVQVFDAISRGSDSTITTLNRLGYDGVRTVRALTAVSNESGSIRAGMAQSQAGLTSDAVDKGAKAAMAGMVDELQKLREEAKLMAEVFAERFGPAMTQALSAFEKFASGIRSVMEGPFGDLLQAVAAAVAPLAAFGGGLLLIAGALAKLAAGALLLKGSGFMGLREGFAGNSRIVQTGSRISDRAPIFGPAGGGPLGTTGRQIVNNGSWFQRMMYNPMNLAGQGMGAAWRASGIGAGGAPMWQRMLAAPINAGAWGARNIGTGLFSPLTMRGWDDPTQRTRMFQSPTMSGSLANAMPQWMSRMVNNVPIGPMPQTAVQSATANVSQAATNVAAARSAGALTGAFGNLMRATGTLGIAAGSAALNVGRLGAAAALYGAKAGAQGALGSMARNPGGWGMAAGAGLLATGVAGNMGLQNTALLALMGGMAGPWGAAAGAGVGAVMDMSAQNDSVDAAKESFDEIKDKSDSLAEQWQAYADYEKEYFAFQEKLEKGNTVTGAITDPGAMLAATQNTWEGIWGKSESREQFEEADQRYKSMLNLRDAVTGIAEALNTPISGDMEEQMASLDKVITTVIPNMEELGITLEDLEAAHQMKNVDPRVLEMWKSLGFSVPGGGMSYDEMVEAITLPGKATGLWDRLSAQSPEGSAFMRDRNVQSALAFPEDVNLQYQAINSRIAGMLGPGGMSLRQIIRSSGELQAVAGDEGAPEYILNQAIAAQAREALSYKMPFMGRTAGYSQQAGLFTDQVNMMAGDPRQQEAMNEAKAQFAQATIGQVQYFQQLLYQQREFEISQDRALFDFGVTRERMDEEYYISRERAQYDFHLQRQYQEHDYQLSRQRAEQDYDTQRERAQDNFARSMRRGQRDFNISRRRQEEDYHHQVRLMVEQTAQQSLNIYERTATQRTASGGYLLFNAQDQLEQMQGQTDALDKLRGMGLTDDVIQQLGLTDAQNAQQAMRLATEAANNPEMIAQLNRAIRKRLRATRQLVTDESNKDWQEFQRQYELSVSRAAEDFERSIRRARKDFGIQMNQMEDDFQLMMNRGAEDYETAQARQQRAFSMSMSRAAEDYARNVENMTEDFHRSMRRAKDDLERSSEEISGTMTQILNRAVRSLTGNAREQAIEVRRTMRGLRGELGESGNDIMTLLAAIFGFRYNPVDVQVGPPGTRQPNNDGYGPQEPGPSGHDGTVLPGRSIGRDNMHYYSPEHGGLHLAGGEAIMVPEWVDAVGGPAKVMEMNKAARYGRSFFLGGTMPTDASQITRHSPSDYDFATWAGDLNDPGSGDLGDPVKAWKRGVVAQVKDIGDTSYGRYIVINHGDQTSWYAHLSKFGVEPGDQVAAGQYIGNVGDYGRSYGPHLHFEVRGGSVAIGDMSGTRTGSSASLSDVLKDRYVDVERIAAEVGLGDPGGGLLFRPGRASSLLNRAARDTWKKLVKRYGAPQGQHGSMGQIPTAPQDLTGNKAIGKAIAERMGWDGAQWDALHELWMRESGWNHQADNPSSSAYGIPQALMALHDLPSGYVGRTTGSGADMQGYGGDPEVQIRWGLNYIKNRYGDPLDALGFHDSNNWYAKGGVFDSPQMIGVGEAGPEMVLPLDSRGAHFISDIMSKMSVGNEGKASHLMGSTPMIVHNANTYHVDRSTTFSGPITVQANNPGQFLHQMQQRQRLMALSQSAIGGKRV